MWNRFNALSVIQNGLLRTLQAGLTAAMLWAWAHRRATAGDVAFAISAFQLMAGYLHTLPEAIRGLQKGLGNAMDAAVFDRTPPQVADLAARQARAYDFISRLPEGFDTLVGERGVKLSGGERQRVAIARAFLADAPILVLDEATSYLGVETERLVFAAGEALMRGRTTIVIAHRLATIRHADRILVFQDGRVVEEGRHGELVAFGGSYARLQEVAEASE